MAYIGNITPYLKEGLPYVIIRNKEGTRISDSVNDYTLVRHPELKEEIFITVTSKINWENKYPGCLHPEKNKFGHNFSNDSFEEISLRQYIDTRYPDLGDIEFLRNHPTIIARLLVLCNGDISSLGANRHSIDVEGGFLWGNTKEGAAFWNEILGNKKPEHFYGGSPFDNLEEEIIIPALPKDYTPKSPSNFEITLSENGTTALSTLTIERQKEIFL